MRLAIILAVFLMGFGLSASAQEPVPQNPSGAEDGEDSRAGKRPGHGAEMKGHKMHRARVRAMMEYGIVVPLAHTIQLGEQGTEFDYVEEGGQEVYYPFMRMGLEARFAKRHNVIFVLQPLSLGARVRLHRDIQVVDQTFAADTPMLLQYDFPFVRVSYLYDFIKSEQTELGVGLSLQLRNATIGFESADGTQRVDRRNIGLVPILKVRGRHQFESQWWLGMEVDGFYAPGRFINLSDNMVEGLIVDASARVGMKVSRHFDTFLNLRYFGGGSEGTSEPEYEGDDGYTSNWLHLFTASIGFYFDFNPGPVHRERGRKR